MSINIKTLKNFKKISKDFSKVIKQELKEKPNLRIGMNWKDDFLKVSDNLKKLKKLDWSQSKIFPLAIYEQEQIVPLDKDLIEKFVDKINFNKMNYENMYKILQKLIPEDRVNDLFLFNTTGGVDLMIFFIDSRGNFVFNDYESKRQYLNRSNNGKEIVSAGIKSILKAKKIICFCIEESSKDVVSKLNKKYIDEDDILTYLQMHNDVTLYTLYSIIQKKEINHDSMTQNVQELREKLLNIKDDDKFFESLEEDKDSEEINSENLDLENMNKNMDNLDKELSESISIKEKELEEINEIENKENNLFDTEEKRIEDKEIINELDMTNSIIENEPNVDDCNLENDLTEQIINNEEKNVDESHSEELDINNSIDDVPSIDLSKFYSNFESDNEKQKKDDLESAYSNLDRIKSIQKVISNKSQLNNISYDSNGLPNDPEELRKYIEIKKETLKQIEDIFLENKLVELKNKTQEKYMLLKKLRELNAQSAKSSKEIIQARNIRENNLNDLNETLDNEKTPFENGNFESSSIKYILQYIPGLRPTPMLMVWHDKNEKFYNELVENMKEKLNLEFSLSWDESHEHVWNDGSYIVFNKTTHEIKSIAFESDDRLIFLMRYINKPLFLKFSSEQNYEILKHLLINKEDELKVEKI